MPAQAKSPLIHGAFVMALCSGAASAPATQFSAGNLLVVDSPSRTLREYTRGGTLIQTLPIPLSGTDPPEHPRDLVALDGARVMIYNGTFTPLLSLYDSASGTWTHQSEPGWSTINNSRYGGIAQLGDAVFVTDMNTGAPPQTQQGLLRFDRANSTWTRFGALDEFNDVTVGLDGRIYALLPNSGAGASIRVFNAATLSLERTVSILEGSGPSGIAVDVAGNIIVAGSDRWLRRFSPDGALLGSLQVTSNLADVDLAANGDILAAGTRSVFLTTESLGSFSSFTLSGSITGVFAAFAVPEPNTLYIFVLTIALFPRRDIRRTRELARHLLRI